MDITVTAWTAAQVARKVIDNKELFILDVRNADAFEDWKIGGHKFEYVNISYFACPFCYIAKTRLDEAIAGLGMIDDMNIVYKAYQLKPDASKEHAPKIELKSDVQDAIVQHAKEVGVTFHFEKLTAGNSEHAHRLAKWAATYGKGKLFFDTVMQRY